MKNSLPTTKCTQVKCSTREFSEDPQSLTLPAESSCSPTGSVSVLLGTFLV